MTLAELERLTKEGRFNKSLEKLNGKEAVEPGCKRLLEMRDEFSKLFGENRDVRIFSAPGRTEIGGNHTDHQHGRVLAASVNMDILCLASANDDGVIRIKSKGYPLDEIGLNILSPVEKEKNKAAAMIRGVAARLNERGYKVSGFDAYTVSSVLKGSGLSSSAAFEMGIGAIISGLFNDGEIDPVELAKAGQYAENVFCGKPSGLMDQTASSVGGFVAIDFKNPEEPVIEKIDFDFRASGYDLCVVDTGGNHADLTHEYASMPAEMCSVALELGADVLRHTDEAEFYKKIPQLRQKCGDRAVLRAMHFYDDNKRVPLMVDALHKGDMDEFLRHINESGRSSQNRLQNIFACCAPEEQGLSLALAFSDRILAGKGAYRVHGGGIAGTIQAFVPCELTDEYVKAMEEVFGENSVHILSIRPVGETEILIEE